MSGKITVLKRGLSFLLALVLVVSLLPVGAVAAEYSDDAVALSTGYCYTRDPGTWEFVGWEMPARYLSSGDDTEYPVVNSQEEIFPLLREAMKKRESSVSVSWTMTMDEYTAILTNEDEWLQECLQGATTHTGDPKEGDSLYYVLAGIGYAADGYAKNGTCYLVFTFPLAYYTTAQQEAELDAEVEELMASFAFTEETTDYDKVAEIYNYLCENIEYDYTNLENEDYLLKYTAYAALMNGTAVCQGYAALMYRLLLEAGVDCRVISGYSGGPHAWNIVGLDGLYYNADSTWDVVYPEHDAYFLKAEFDDHIRDAKFLTEEFNAAYPMSRCDYPHNYVDGVCQACGEEQKVVYRGTLLSPSWDLEWELTGSGVLTITGTGMVPAVWWASPWLQQGVDIVEIRLGEGITGIGENAFRDCAKLAKVELPESLTEIGSGVFSGCSALTSIDIPDGVTAMGTAALSGTALVHVELPSGLTEVPHNLFNGCTALKSVEWPESVTALGNGVFYGCTSLTEMDIPDTVVSMGTGVFGNCTALKKVTIGTDYDGLNHIPAETFKGCTMLTDVVFSGEAPYVGSIGDWAFYECSSLVKIDFPYTVTEVGQYAFGYCFALEEFHFYPVQRIGEGAFWLCSALEEVNFSSSLQTIGAYAFRECSSLKEVVIQQGVYEIPEEAFGLCTALEYVFIPPTVNAIGESAFGSCTSLSKVIMSENVKTIGSRAFAKTALTEIKLSEGLTSIGGGAFSESGLTGVVIPSTVTEIGDMAFAYCLDLVEVTFMGDGISGNQYTFYRDWNDTCITMYYPGGNDTWTDEVMDSHGNYKIWKPWGECSGEHTVVTDPAVAATCYATGLTEGSHCSVCGGVFAAQEVTEMHSATLVTIPGQAPTCEYAGWADCIYCELCNVIISDSVGLDALGHTIENGVCTVCGHVATAKDYLTYTFGENWWALDITGCADSVAAIAIPEYIDGSQVASISDGDFSSCSGLMSVLIPACVTTIGADAFTGCPAGMVIFGYSGSAAETFAQNAGRIFVALDDESDPIIVPLLSDVINDDGKPVVIYCTGGLGKLVRILVNGEVLDPFNYTLKQGSTIVTFTDEYLDTLPAGDHEVTLDYGDKTVSTTVTVVAHTYGDWYSTYPGNCMVPGTERRDCSHCDAVQTRETGLGDHVYENGSCIYCWAAEPPAVTYGDTNGDGVVNTVDLAILRRYLANIDPLTGESSVTVQTGADANGDGKISTLDLALLRRYLANVDPATGESSVVLGPKN